MVDTLAKPSVDPAVAKLAYLDQVAPLVLHALIRNHGMTGAALGTQEFLAEQAYQMALTMWAVHETHLPPATATPASE